jgi:hypothetical protein
MRCKFAAKLGKIQSSVDLPHQMIFGNRVAKMKLVEQLTLVTLQTARSWIDLASTQRNHGSPHLSTDFCNKICQNRTLAQQQDTHAAIAFSVRASTIGSVEPRSSIRIVRRFISANFVNDITHLTGIRI